ncbi:hypothetical protein EI94DRAFT_1702087 [Lactarius quietus]|nr:hypothetical protein EI94DRAFT_1702087 [Lactarius quietus]
MWIILKGDLDSLQLASMHTAHKPNYAIASINEEVALPAAVPTSSGSDHNLSPSSHCVLVPKLPGSSPLIQHCTRPSHDKVMDAQFKLFSSGDRVTQTKPNIKIMAPLSNPWLHILELDTTAASCVREISVAESSGIKQMGQRGVSSWEKGSKGEWQVAKGRVRKSEK